MHRPELLILDEPTSGLDPIVQREVHDLVKEATRAGRTVLMSSHVLSEVQATADRVAVINRGRLVALEAMENVHARAQRKIDVRFAGPADRSAIRSIAALRDVQLSGDHLVATLVGSPDPLVAALANTSLRSLTVTEPPLEDMFFDAYRNEAHDAA